VLVGLLKHLKASLEDECHPTVLWQSCSGKLTFWQYMPLPMFMLHGSNMFVLAPV